MAGYRGPIVDVDVHNGPKSEASLRKYLPKRWDDYRLSILPLLGPDFLGRSALRRSDAWGPTGEFPGTDYLTMKEQLLDKYGYFRAVLTHDVGHYPMLPNQYFMRDVCRAANEWMVDEWLSQDDRLYSVIIPPVSLPQECAAEIKRFADHPRMLGILLASVPLGRPYGDPIYDPMYAAAEEHGLTVSLHPGAAQPGKESTGLKQSTGDQVTVNSLHGMHHLTSMIVHGVFEKFPGLRVIIKEHGVGWLPWVMWRMDAEYDRLREESPWVKKWPSEYIREHVKLSTQPLEDGPRTTDIAEYLSVIDGIEDLLCFSSDYPHSTMDDPRYIGRLLPESWHRKVFCDNACSTYGWETPAADWQQTAAASA